MAIVNTNTRINQFIEHGFTKEQAEFLVEEIVNEDSTKIKIDVEVIKRTMSTKEDVTKLESKIETINTNIKWIVAIGLLILGILVKSTFIHYHVTV
jgi:hypothetical protein